MANKRKLKKHVNQVCEDLFTELVAASLYGHKFEEPKFSDVMYTLIHMQHHYTSRISHPEPGLSAKAYFKNLRESFDSDVDELVDQINA